jgi:hypothetical protein
MATDPAVAPQHPLGDPGQLTQIPAGSAGTLAAGTLAGALVTVGIWVAKKFFGIDVPAELAAPLTTIVVSIGSGIYIIGLFLVRHLMR